MWFGREKMQATNSLLTQEPIYSEKIPGDPVFPREKKWIHGSLLTPSYLNRENEPEYWRVLPGLSCPLRSKVCSWLGEGSIRSLQKYFSCLVVFCMAVLFAPDAFCSGGILMNLKEQACVRSNQVVVADVAELHGSDSNRIDRLKQVRLTISPVFGTVKALSRNQVRELIETAAGPLQDVEITGAVLVQIKRQGRQVIAEEIYPVLKTYILESLPWTASEVEIVSVGNLKGTEIPLEDAVLRVPPNTTLSGLKNTLIPIEIVQSGKPLYSFWITADIRVRATVLAAAKRIPSGKIITAEDIKEVESDIEDCRPAYVRNAGDIIGKASRRLLVPDDVLTHEYFVDPFLVRSGEVVRLRLDRNGIALSTLVRAEQDGRLGQVIRVRNVDFDKVLKAQVTGPSEVRIQ
jgi:flagella basal body P-ring formation protein FlgA